MLGLKKVRRRDPARAAEARSFLGSIGLEFAHDRAGDDAPAPEPVFGGESDQTRSDKELADNHVRREERSRRVARLARRIYDRIAPRDPTEFVSVETIAQELRDERLPGESTADFLAVIREAGEASGRYDKTASKGSAAVASGVGTEADSQRLAVCLALNGGDLSDDQAERMADAATKGNYSRGRELDEWIGRVEAALRSCPPGSSSIAECKSALESLRQRKRFNQPLDTDDRNALDNLLLHAENDRERAASSAGREPYGNGNNATMGNRTGGAVRTPMRRFVR
jgi:hypothetical protein